MDKLSLHLRYFHKKWARFSEFWRPVFNILLLLRNSASLFLQWKQIKPCGFRAMVYSFLCFHFVSNLAAKQNWEFFRKIKRKNKVNFLLFTFRFFSRFIFSRVFFSELCNCTSCPVSSFTFWYGDLGSLNVVEMAGRVWPFVTVRH